LGGLARQDEHVKGCYAGAVGANGR